MEGNCTLDIKIEEFCVKIWQWLRLLKSSEAGYTVRLPFQKLHFCAQQLSCRAHSLCCRILVFSGVFLHFPVIRCFPVFLVTASAFVRERIFKNQNSHVTLRFRIKADLSGNKFYLSRICRAIAMLLIPRILVDM